MQVSTIFVIAGLRRVFARYSYAGKRGNDVNTSLQYTTNRYSPLNPLVLDGYGVRIRVQGSELELTNGKLDDRLQSSLRFRPRTCPFDSVVIDAFSGYVSMRAMMWLAKNQIPLFMVDYDGTLLSSTLPREPIKSEVRLAQYQAVNDPKKKYAIAKALIE